METIYEALDKAYKNAGSNAYFGNGFKAGAEFAQRWTSVEEELPPLGVPVTCKYNMFGKECYWSGTFYTEERLMHFIKKHLMITHWRLIELN